MSQYIFLRYEPQISSGPVRYVPMAIDIGAVAAMGTHQLTRFQSFTDTAGRTWTTVEPPLYPERQE